MPESNPWVRVLDTDTGHERSVRKSEVPHGNYDLLDKEAEDQFGDPLPPEFHTAEPTSLYDSFTVADLKAEIDKRNAERDPEGENYLSTEGKKGDLIATLETDDLSV